MFEEPTSFRAVWRLPAEASAKDGLLCPVYLQCAQFW